MPASVKMPESGGPAGSWLEDSGSLTCSDLESGSKQLTDSEDVMSDASTDGPSEARGIPVCCLENSGIHPKRSAFFRLGKNKMHRKTSLRQSLHKSQHSELCDMVERDETTTLSLTPDRSAKRFSSDALHRHLSTGRRPIPVQRTPEGQQRTESLSRLGWTVEAGQKLTLVQVCCHIS